MNIKRNHRQIFGAAIAAAMGMSASPAMIPAQGRDSVTIPIHKAPAPAKKGEAMAVENLLCSGRSKQRARKAWPFSGKNRTQRNNMASGFQCF